MPVCGEKPMPHHRDASLDWSSLSLEDVLQLAIEDEEQARDYYLLAAGLAGNNHTRALLSRLSEMEQGHADQLRAELDELRLQKELEAGIAD
jgi:rubrerythrin